MRNKEPYSFIDINNDEEGDIAYCPKCKEVGRMTEKLYEWQEDPENWCICQYGHRHPYYTTETEGKWSFPFDHVDTPFESGSRFESIGKRKPHDRLKDYRENEDDT